jgi:hypothetical protein
MGTNTKNIKDITPTQPLVTVEEDSPEPKKALMGRPKGAKNKDTLFKELMTGQFQDIAQDQVGRTLQVLFEKAHEGDMKAIKLIMDRVVPVTKAVDLADMEKKGLTINISVGSMEEAALIEAGEIEDGDFTEMED